MSSTVLALVFGMSGTAVAMCAAGVLFFLVGLLAARHDLSEARGLERIVALSHVSFGVPLAVFGALHLFDARSLAAMVPAYMPWHLFWAYFVGAALIAAAASIVSRIAVRWSGLLFGIMMFLFVAMIHLPGALAQPHDRIIRTIVFRETAFGGGAWILAGWAMDPARRGSGRAFVAVGRVFVTLAMIVFGVEHLLHATGLPGVPLQKEIPAWLPGRALVDYLTGAGLLVAAGSVVSRWKTRTVLAGLGGWLLLMVLLIYGPVLITALLDPAVGVEIEGINYFADTLLFSGTLLALAKATPPVKPAPRPDAVG